MDANILAARGCAQEIERYVPGFRPEKLGCGSSGCVFPAGPGRVAKVSWAADDAAIAIEIMRLGIQRPPELPEVFGVFRIPRTHPCLRLAHRDPDMRWDPFFVTVREDLAHVTPVNARAVSAVLAVLESYGEIPWWATERYNRRTDNYGVDWQTNVALFWPSALPPPGPDWRRFKQYLAAALKQAVATMDPEDQKIIQHYLRLRKWAARRGWVLLDVRVPNLGLRAQTGEIVLRDFGELRRDARRHGRTDFHNRYMDKVPPGRLIPARRRRR